MSQYKLTQEQMEQGFRLEKIFDKYALYDKNNNHWFLDKFTIEQSIKASIKDRIALLEKKSTDNHKYSKN